MHRLATVRKQQGFSLRRVARLLSLSVDEIKLLEDVEIEIREVVNVLEPLRLPGCAETRMLGNEHVEALRELLHEGQDRGHAVRPVQIEERLARAAAAQVDPATVDLDETLGECHERFAVADS